MVIGSQMETVSRLNSKQQLRIRMSIQTMIQSGEWSKLSLLNIQIGVFRSHSITRRLEVC